MIQKKLNKKGRIELRVILAMIMIIITTIVAIAIIRPLVAGL
jgi:hypothetical protein